jgi:hypothetical protein
LLSLITSVSIAQQTDTAGLARDSSSLITQPAVPGQQTPAQHTEVDFNEDNSVQVQSEEVPPNLRKALEGEEYRGWESGNIYRNIQTNEFKVEIIQGQSKKEYFFDKNGTLQRMR